jgi:hypothetical protein
MVLYEQFAVASWLRCLLHCLLHVWYFSHPFATRIRTKTSGVTLTPFTGIVVLLLGKRFQGAALASTSPRDSTEVLTASSPTRARRWGSFCSWAAGNLLRISAQRWCGIFVDLWCWAARPAGQIARVAGAVRPARVAGAVFAAGLLGSCCGSQPSAGAGFLWICGAGRRAQLARSRASLGQLDPRASLGQFLQLGCWEAVADLSPALVRDFCGFVVLGGAPSWPDRSQGLASCAVRLGTGLSFHLPLGKLGGSTSDPFASHLHRSPPLGLPSLKQALDSWPAPSSERHPPPCDLAW